MNTIIYYRIDYKVLLVLLVFMYITYNYKYGYMYRVTTNSLYYSCASNLFTPQSIMLTITAGIIYIYIKYRTLLVITCTTCTRP